MKTRKYDYDIRRINGRYWVHIFKTTPPYRDIYKFPPPRPRQIDPELSEFIGKLWEYGRMSKMLLLTQKSKKKK